MVGCNKGLVHLHSNNSLNYTQIYEYPILLFNGYGGKEVIMDGMALSLLDDSVGLNNPDYSIASFKLTLYTRIDEEKKPKIFNITGNQIKGDAHKYLFLYHVYKFSFSDIIIKDKWGHYAKPLYKKTTFYTFHL